MDGIIVELNEKNHFNKIYCIENHYITDYKEGDNIMTFLATKVMYAPLDYDLSNYHCIDEEEYNRLMDLQEEEIKKHAVFA